MPSRTFPVKNLWYDATFLLHIRMAGAPKRRAAARLPYVAGLWNGCFQPDGCWYFTNANPCPYGCHNTCTPNRATGGDTNRPGNTTGSRSVRIGRVE